MTKKDLPIYVGNKIREYRKLKKLTQKQLGERIGVKHNTISSYESGTNAPEQDMLFALAEQLDISINDLFPSTKEFMYEEVKKNHSNIREINVYGTISAGEALFAEQYIEGTMPVLSSLLDRSKEYFFLKVKGDSMNLEFTEGTLVLIERTTSVENGQIAAVLIDAEEATVKKVSVSENANTVTLIPLSSNPEYVPTTYERWIDRVRILGRVVQAVKVY
jgi:repressor LexA